MLWQDIVPHVSFVAILEKNFFPRWLHVLGAWLMTNPNYDEVTKWYIGWKSLFPEQLLADATIKGQLLKEAIQGWFVSECAYKIIFTNVKII